MLESFGIVVGLGKRGQDHRHLSLTYSSCLETILFSLFPDQAIEAWQCKSNHKEDKAEHVSDKEDDEHDGVEKSSRIDKIAVVRVAEKYIETVYHPN